MHGYHSPIYLIAKLGVRWALLALAVFVLLNPVTWGVALALADHFNPDARWGDWFFGRAQTETHGTVQTPAQGYCEYHIQGHVFIIATDCSKVHFRGPERGA